MTAISVRERLCGAGVIASLVATIDLGQLPTHRGGDAFRLGVRAALSTHAVPS